MGVCVGGELGLEVVMHACNLKYSETEVGGVLQFGASLDWEAGFLMTSSHGMLKDT